MVVAPFRCQYTVGVLSYMFRVVRSATSAYCASISLCATAPANSKSLLVMSPWGLSKLTSRSRTQSGNGDRHKTGCVFPFSSGIKCIPPMPLPAASQAPKVAGYLSGTSSAIRVGREATSSARFRKSSRKPCSALLSLRRGRSFS